MKTIFAIFLFLSLVFPQTKIDSISKIDNKIIIENNSLDTLQVLRNASPVKIDSMKPNSNRVPLQQTQTQENSPQTSAYTNIKIQTPVISIDLIMDLYDKDIDFDIRYEGRSVSGASGIAKKIPTESDIAKLVSSSNPANALTGPIDSLKQKDSKKAQLPYSIEDANYNKALVYINNAQKYFSNRRYTNALWEINRAIESAPNVAMSYAVKGSILFMLKQNDEAKQSWERALELDPMLDNVRALLFRMY